MTLLAIILSFLLFTCHSHSASTESFGDPENWIPVKEAVKSNSRRLTHYSEEELKRRGLEFNPYAKRDFLKFVKAHAEYARNKIDKTGSLKKGGSIYDFIPVDSIRAYRQELKRNDEPLEIYTDDPCAVQ